jgi:hypothetical protein
LYNFVFVNSNATGSLSYYVCAGLGKEKNDGNGYNGKGRHEVFMKGTSSQILVSCTASDGVGTGRQTDFLSFSHIILSFYIFILTVIYYYGNEWQGKGMDEWTKWLDGDDG